MSNRIFKGNITKGNQSVNVMQEEGLIGYVYEAIGKDSLPLAVDLALKQTRNLGLIPKIYPIRLDK